MLTRNPRSLAAAFAVAAAFAAALAIVAIIAMRSSETPRLPAASAPPDTPALGAFVLHPQPKPAVVIAAEGRDGARLPLAGFAGRTLLVNFWATWCAPCIEEMPALDRLAGRLAGPDFAVVLVAVDRIGREKAAAFLDGLGVARAVFLYDAGREAMGAFALRGLPTSIVLDREGREIGRVEGQADWDAPAAEAFLKAALAQ